MYVHQDMQLVIENSTERLKMLSTVQKSDICRTLQINNRLRRY